MYFGGFGTETQDLLRFCESLPLCSLSLAIPNLVLQLSHFASDLSEKRMTRNCESIFLFLLIIAFSSRRGAEGPTLRPMFIHLTSFLHLLTLSDTTSPNLSQMLYVSMYGAKYISECLSQTLCEFSSPNQKTS